ncbi:hypothetical protein [Spirochaeta africana]|uniref:Uncharacterized protein n=1 Tax=Spirochaeta africana (strain ATCC 700263 / DSM 8902 / Z-7692) TaxID=889378 RepID=H9UJL4_SPIAZ|nr:hypothetical protein [Spirochaeta africana]AFG37707.1 hypothetical protein Spiaf_1649 [Spirochaeta africana DSM 8902]
MSRLIRQLAAAAVVAVLSLSSTGCLEIETGIHFDGPESGTVRSHYLVPAELAEFSEIQPTASTALQPLEREYIQDYLAGVAGARLMEYHRDQGDSVHELQTVIRFETWDALQQLMELLGMEIHRSAGEDGFDLLVAPAEDQPLDSNPFLRDIGDVVSIRVEVQAPEDVVSVEGFDGMSAHGRTARFDVPVVAAITSPEPIWMRVRW